MTATQAARLEYQAVVLDRRARPRLTAEGRCGECGGFGPVELHFGRCEGCMREIRT